MSQPEANPADISPDGMYALFKRRTGIADVFHQQSVEVQIDYFGEALEKFHDEVARSIPTELNQQAAAINNGKLFDHLLRVMLGWQENRKVMVYGRTQTGKTSIKALLAVICRCWTVPVVIVTTQCSEARELSTKLRHLMGNRDLVHCAADRLTLKGQKALIHESILGNGILVLASTSSTQLASTCKILRQYQAKAPWPGARTFALVWDESDAVCRSDKGALAKQVVQMQKLDPCVTMCTTATPFPSWLLGTGIEDCDFVNFCLSPTDQYVSLEDMVPFQDDKKEPVFLPRDGLDQGGIFTFRCTNSLRHVTHDAEDVNGLFASTSMESPSDKWTSTVTVGTTYNIPYCTDDVVKFYKAALHHAKGVLVLDCMVPWVNVADSSVLDKASLVQNLLAGAAGKKRSYNIVAIVSTGDGVSYRLPGHASGWKCAKRVLLGQVIEQIDQAFGLTLPIIVFAYRTLNRSVSARSSRRFPTHLCVYKAKGNRRAEDFIQTLGRGTGNGRAVLTANGFAHVTLLTTESDWTMSLAGVALADRVAQGTVSLDEVLKSADGKMSWNKTSAATVSKEEAEYIKGCQKMIAKKKRKPAKRKRVG